MENKMYRLIVISLLLKCFLATAQEPSFIHYGVDDGLPSNLIYSMTQDKEGFLWFGTDKGLARFDGQRFHVFGTSDGLPDSEILNVESDNQGRLWISPFRQNPCFWENGVFHTAQSDSILNMIHQKSSFFDFQEDALGRIWFFGGEREAYCLDGTSIRKIKFSATPRCFFQVDTLEFIITLPLIIKLENQQEDTPAMNLTPLIDKSKMQSVSGVSIINHQILICITNTLILLQYENGKFVVQDTLKGYTGQVYSAKSGDFVLTTYGQGAILLDCSQGRINVKNHILPGKKVNMVFEDNQGILWLCTPDEGVYGLPPNTPQNYVNDFHPHAHNITSISIDRKNRIITGNDEGGIFFFQNGEIKYINLGSIDGSNRVLKIIPLNNGKLMVATDERIYSIHNEKIEAYTYVSTPKSILHSNQKLWVASSSGIGYYPDDTKKFEIIIHNKRFTSIEEDDEGYIWAGGMEGLFSSVDRFLFNSGEFSPHLKTRIITLLHAGPGLMWASTPNDGLLLLYIKGGKVTGVEKLNDKLTNPINNIKNIYIDHNNNLWMGTNKGVFMLKNDFSIVHFDKHDGIIDNDINTLLVQEDTLWVGTTIGLTKILLVSYIRDRPFPTFVTGIKYRLKEKIFDLPFLSNYHTNRNITLPSDATMLEIQLSGLDYSSRGNIQFEYIQKEEIPPLKWLTTDNILSLIFNPGKVEKTIIFENTLNLGTRLRPGKYSFLFTAFNTRDDKSIQPDVLIIIQQPHWYETIWFWLVVWFLIFIILLKIYKDRMAYRDLNTSVSKLRLQALQAQMNPHFIGNSIYAIQQFFYPPDPEKASEYIELFNRLLRQTMLMSERHFVSFSEDLNYYKDYLSMIQLRFGDRFSYQISGSENIPPNTPFPVMILQPIIENATIHGLATNGISHLKILFEQHGVSTHCIVEDNGEGFNTTQERAKKNETKRKSKGLQLLYQKINTLNRLYNINIKLEILDLNELNQAWKGTRVWMSYDPDKLKNPEILNDKH